jgi:hypothetical protein
LASDESKLRRVHHQASQSEILPEPALPVSPATGVGDTMSLSRFVVGQWYDQLASESTGLLVNTGFGAQLLTTRLGQGGVGLSQGAVALKYMLKNATVIFFSGLGDNFLTSSYMPATFYFFCYVIIMLSH